MAVHDLLALPEVNDHLALITYYLLLQLGHLFFQLLEKGSLLRALAAAYAKATVARLWGGQDKLAQRLLEALRYFLLPKATPDPPCRISFLPDTS